MSSLQNVITVTTVDRVVFAAYTVLPCNFPSLCGNYRSYRGITDAFPHYRVIL